jgi:hypothetical protein
MPFARSPRFLTETGFIEPMQCLIVDALPEGPKWAYEFKLNGYRALGIKIGERIRLLSRNAKDLSARFPSIVKALTGLPDERLSTARSSPSMMTGVPRSAICRTIRLPALRSSITYSTC